MNIFNTKVSCFKNYYSPEEPKDVTLFAWLTTDKYKEDVQKIRSIQAKEEKDKLKAKLPCITPHGTFSYGDDKSFLSFSGFMQIDIDPKGNEHIRNLTDLKRFMASLPYVAFCGLSASGKGCWLLIRIKSHKDIKDHFKALAKDWKECVGIKLDPTRSDLSGFRGASYDPEAYFNFNAIHYTKKLPSKQHQPIYKRSYSLAPSDPFGRAVKNLNDKGIFFVDGAKHDFIFKLCCSLNTYGIDKHEAEAWINTNLIPLNQIRSNCIEDAFRRYSHDFASYSKDQISIIPYQQAKQEVSPVVNTLKQSEILQHFIRKNPCINELIEKMDLSINPDN